MLQNYYCIKFKCRQDNPFEDIWFNQTANKVSLMKDIHLSPRLLINLMEIKGEHAVHLMLLFSGCSIIFTRLKKSKRKKERNKKDTIYPPFHALTVQPFLNWAIFKGILPFIFFNILKCSMPLKFGFQLGKGWEASKWEQQYRQCFRAVCNCEIASQISKAWEVMINQTSTYSLGQLTNLYFLQVFPSEPYCWTNFLNALSKRTPIVHYRR